MIGIGELPKGYCEAFGGEARYAATASHCREANGCTAANCPLESTGSRPQSDVGFKVLSGPYALMTMDLRRPRRG